MFKTAEELKISPAERDGLIKILALFETQPPEHVRHTDELASVSKSRARIQRATGPAARGLGFTMAFGAAVVAPYGAEPTPYECGAACCLGGHLSLHMQGFDLATQSVFSVEALARADAYVLNLDRWDSPLYRLFFPSFGSEFARLTPAHGAEAVRHFLTHGVDNWDEIFERDIIPALED